MEQSASVLIPHPFSITYEIIHQERQTFTKYYSNIQIVSQNIPYDQILIHYTTNLLIKQHSISKMIQTSLGRLNSLLHNITRFLYFTSTSRSNNQYMDSIDKKKQNPELQAKSKWIILGGGCFWCIEGLFRRVNGVVSVHSGYAGGKINKPTYEQVCTGKTGHAQVCKVFYDPIKIPLRDLFRIFFTIHDPTTLNSQGPDHGTQYRSVIYYTNQQQGKIAQEVKKEFEDSKQYPNKIVTQIEPLQQYFQAQDYHQNYFDLNKDKNPYCQIVYPKISKLMKKFSQYYFDPTAKS